MSLLSNINKLATRCDMKIHKNDLQLLKQKRRQQEIVQKIAELGEALEAVSRIRDRLYPSGELSREQLFAVQRRQAALRRQMAEIALQRAQQASEQAESEKACEAMQLTKRNLLRKQDKYGYLHNIERKKQRVIAHCSEERELEEIMACRT